MVNLLHALTEVCETHAAIVAIFGFFLSFFLFIFLDEVRKCHRGVMDFVLLKTCICGTMTLTR